MKHTNKLCNILPFALLLLLLAACSDKIDMAQNIPTGGSLGTALTEEKEENVTELLPPEQLFSSEGLYSDRIMISWSEVKGAASYKLERAVKSKDDDTPPGDDEFETICASKDNIVDSSYITTTLYIDRILDNPVYSSEEYQNVYYYRISAENAKTGIEPSEYSAISKGFLLAPPLKISATAGESTEEIVIEWQHSDKAKQYNVYRSTNENNSSPLKIATVTSDRTEFSDKITQANQGVNFFYSIEAVNNIGETSVKSPVALGYALKDGAPARVQNVKVTSGRGENTNSISVSWDEVNGEGIEYTIYRTSSTDSSMTLIKKGETGTTLTDKKNLMPNTYYYYRVVAYVEKNGEEIKGPLSKSSATDKNPDGTSTAAEGFILSPPNDVFVQRVDTTYKISFSQPIGENGYIGDSHIYADDYKEYEYEIFGGETKEDVSTPIPYSPVFPTASYYTVTVPQYKFYKVITKYESTESSPSEIVAPSPSAAQNVSATKAAYIEGYTTPNYTASSASTPASANNKFNKNGVYPVKITWTAPADGADGGYNIYRSTKSDSGFRKINESAVKDLFYIDENESAKTGVYYYYRVLSLNSLEKGTNYSNIDYGYGALNHNQYMREYNKTIMRSQKKLTLMHKSPDTSKLGSESINGDISGTLAYNAAMAGLGARITMHYENYSDFYIGGNSSLGVYFNVTGDTNTSASMDASGTMDGTVTCKGMYPGVVDYNGIQIKGGGAGGGYYKITPAGFPSVDVDYRIGNE